MQIRSMVLTLVFTLDSSDVSSSHKHTIQSFSTDILGNIHVFTFLGNTNTNTNLAVLEARKERVQSNTIAVEIPPIIKGSCL